MESGIDDLLYLIFSVHLLFFDANQSLSYASFNSLFQALGQLSALLSSRALTESLEQANASSTNYHTIPLDMTPFPKLATSHAERR